MICNIRYNVKYGTIHNYFKKNIFDDDTKNVFTKKEVISYLTKINTLYYEQIM